MCPQNEAVQKRHFYLACSQIVDLEAFKMPSSTNAIAFQQTAKPLEPLAHKDEDHEKHVCLFGSLASECGDCFELEMCHHFNFWSFEPLEN